MQTFGFFNSKNGDRKYTAEEMSHYFEGLVGNGILENCGGKLQVLHTEGMGIKVQSGRAFLDCHWYNNSADVLLEVPQSEITYDRIDSVILRMDTAEEVRSIALLIRKGTPAEDPVAPELENTESIKELCLADIRVNKLVEAISQANITDTRTSEKCGFVTGLIKQVDTSTLFLQWQTAYQEYYTLSTTEFERWKAEQQDGFVTWSNGQKQSFSAWRATREEEYNEWSGEQKQSFSSWRTAREEEYRQWFEGIKDTLESIDASIPIQKDLIIPAKGWVDEVNGNYTKKLVLDVPNIKVNMSIQIIIALESESIAQECGLASMNESGTGMITFYAESVPTQDIKATYYIVYVIEGGVLDG